MKAVILAAGVGRRIYPLCSDRPKCLFEVMGNPLLHYILDGLRSNGLRDLVFVLGNYGDQIKQYMSSQEDFNVQYTHQERPLGMGNALEEAKRILSGEDNFLVLNADDIYDPEILSRILAENTERPTGLTLATTRTETPWKYGVLDLDERGNPRRIVEKPNPGEEPSNLAVLGIYLLTPQIFDFLKQTRQTDQQFEDAYQRYMDNGDAKAVVYDGFFGSFKYPWDILGIADYLMRNRITEQKIDPTAEIHKTTIIDEPVVIREGTRILEYTVIRGPTYIGPDSIIGNHVLIRNSSLGRNCLVGKGTEIARSVIGDGSEFHMNFIGDSVIGENCWFGAGAITGNYKLTRTPVRVQKDGERIPTGRDKLGVITGLDVRIGTGVQISPGTTIGSHTIIGQIPVIKGDIPQGKFVSARIDLVVEDRHDI